MFPCWFAACGAGGRGGAAACPHPARRAGRGRLLAGPPSGTPQDTAGRSHSTDYQDLCRLIIHVVINDLLYRQSSAALFNDIVLFYSNSIDMMSNHDKKYHNEIAPDTLQ